MSCYKSENVRDSLCYYSFDDNVPSSESNEELFSNEDATENFDDKDSQENEVTLDKLYIAILDELSRKILSTVHQFKEKRASINRRAEELNVMKDKPQPRKNWYHLFGSPYFKDKSFFPCPGNEDFYDKLTKNEINYHELPPVRRWKSSDQSKLEKAVRNNLIEIKKKEFKSNKDGIIKKLKTDSKTSEEMEELKLELECLDKKVFEVENSTTENLLKNNNKDLDWLCISVMDFEGQRSSEELQAMWELCLHPSICRKNWTLEENEKLLEIAQKHNTEDWDQIALELNTNRSGFQCFVHYQRNLNKNLRKSKWTEEEDNNLRKIIQECRIGDYIPWSKVALHMKGRTKVQVYNRWTYSIDPVIRKGRFTPEEDCLIVAGVQRYGKDFPRISRFLPGRTSIQIRDRYIGSLQKVGPIGKWTREEDKLLMGLVNRFGTKSWSRIASHFGGRYRTQVRHRYLTLKRWMAKYPELSLQYAPSRYLGEYCNRQTSLWSQVQSLLKSSLKTQKKYTEKQGFREENLLLLKKKLNMVNPKKCGRKAGSGQPLTPSESALMELSKVYFITRKGESKYNLDDGCHRHRKYITGLLFHVFNVRLAFPFDENVIEDDNSLNSADKFILTSLKKIYDERTKNEVDVCGKGTTSEEKILVGKSLATSKSTASAEVERTCDGEWLPLYFDVTTSFQHQGCIPPSFGTLIGYRIAYESRSRLNKFVRTPMEEVIALPSERPPNLRPGDKKVKYFSKEHSEKLFNERVKILFWSTFILKDIKPQLHDEVFPMNMKHSEKKRAIQNYRAKSRNKTGPVKKVNSSKSKVRSSNKTKSEELKRFSDEKGSLNEIKNDDESQKKRLKKNNKENKRATLKKTTSTPSRRSERLSKFQESGFSYY